MATLNIEVQSQVDQAVRDLGRINKGFDLMGKANQDAAGALGVFGVSLTSLSNPLTLVASTIKGSIDYTMKWGDEIDELTRITGTSARESSKLAVVLGDAGISTDRLRGAAKALKEQGLAPSLETLRKLAAEYQTLPEGAARTEWGTKKLGRAYFDLSEILTKTPAQFDELSAAAERSGKIMDEAGIQKAEDFGIKLKQLQDKLDGAKIGLTTTSIAGRDMITWISDAITGGENYIEMWQAIALKTELATGMIDQNTATIRAAELAGLSHADALKQVYAAEMATTDAVERASTAIRNQGEISGTTVKLTEDQASAWVNLYTTMDSTIAANTVLIEKNKEAHEAMVSSSILQAGLAGTLTNAETAYNITIDDTQGKIDELNSKLARLGEMQGQTVTVTKDATASQAELALAQDKVIVSSDKLALAQQKLSENTDPDKQFTLKVAVDSAAVALENAQTKAFNLGGEMGSLSTYTVDNTKKIAELHAELDPLIAKQEAAAVAARHATDEFIYQQLSAGLDADAAIKLAEALGLIDPASAAAATAAQALKAQYDSGKISADEYAGKANALADAINRLQDKNITITQNTIYNETRNIQTHEQGVGGRGGYQHGGSFIIPPGYNENFPIGPRGGASSGEQVTVTPAGQSGGNGETTMLLRQLPGLLARAFRDAMQLAR